MKNYLKILVVGFLLMCLLVGCSDSEDTTEANANEKSTETTQSSKEVEEV